MEARLKARQDIIQKEFDRIHAEETQIVDQGKGLQKRLNEIRVRKSQLNGAYTEVASLLNGEKDTVEELKTKQAQPDKAEEPKKEAAKK